MSKPFAFRSALDELLEKRSAVIRARYACASNSSLAEERYHAATEAFDAAYEAFVDTYKPKS